MNHHELFSKATITANPFCVGDKVKVIHADGTPYDNGHIGTVQRVNGTDIGIGPGWTYLHSRFEKVEEPEVVDINLVLSNKARELAKAIDNGTMVGYYSALGFLMETLQELSAYTQE